MTNNIPKQLQFKDETGPKIVVMNGEIGSGKTTVCQKLAQALTERNYKACIVDEPVTEWQQMGALSAFYNDIEHMTYPFEIYTLTTRMVKLKTVLENNSDIEFLIIDTSILTDKFVFMEILGKDMDPILVKMYDVFYEFCIGCLPKCISNTPWEMIYIKPSLKECMARINSRGRNGEGHISMEYLESMREKYETMARDINTLQHHIKTNFHVFDEIYDNDVIVNTILNIIF